MCKRFIVVRRQPHPTTMHDTGTRVVRRHGREDWQQLIVNETPYHPTELTRFTVQTCGNVIRLSFLLSQQVGDAGLLRSAYALLLQLGHEGRCELISCRLELAAQIS